MDVPEACDWDATKAWSLWLSFLALIACLIACVLVCLFVCLFARLLVFFRVDVRALHEGAGGPSRGARLWARFKTCLFVCGAPPPDHHRLPARGSLPKVSRAPSAPRCIGPRRTPPKHRVALPWGLLASWAPTAGLSSTCSCTGLAPEVVMARIFWLGRTGFLWQLWKCAKQEHSLLKRTFRKIYVGLFVCLFVCWFVEGLSRDDRHMVVARTRGPGDAGISCCQMDSLLPGPPGTFCPAVPPGGHRRPGLPTRHSSLTRAPSATVGALPSA